MALHFKNLLCIGEDTACLFPQTAVILFYASTPYKGVFIGSRLNFGTIDVLNFKGDKTLRVKKFYHPREDIIKRILQAFTTEIINRPEVRTSSTR